MVGKVLGKDRHRTSTWEAGGVKKLGLAVGEFELALRERDEVRRRREEGEGEGEGEGERGGESKRETIDRVENEGHYYTRTGVCTAPMASVT